MITFMAILAVLIKIIPLVVTGANVITAVTPTKVDDKLLGKVTPLINMFLKVANTLAMNFGKNKNKDDK